MKTALIHVRERINFPSELEATIKDCLRKLLDERGICVGDPDFCVEEFKKFTDLVKDTLSKIDFEALGYRVHLFDECYEIDHCNYYIVLYDKDVLVIEYLYLARITPYIDEEKSNEEKSVFGISFEAVSVNIYPSIEPKDIDKIIAPSIESVIGEYSDHLEIAISKT